MGDRRRRRGRSTCRRSWADGLPLAIGVAVLAMLVLLFLMTGSLVVPLKALLMNVVSLGATFGVLVPVFQHGLLSGPLRHAHDRRAEPVRDRAGVRVRFGLSMDYEVFLLGRIKEYVDRGLPNDARRPAGLQLSGRVITSAALLMLIVFGFFACAKMGTSSRSGSACSSRSSIDATLVRCLLVPATMTLLGRWNWWAPSFLRRVHQRFGLRETAPALTLRPLSVSEDRVPAERPV